MYTILQTLESHFPLKDPIKYKAQITMLSEKHGEEPIQVLAYYFHRHYLTYLLHKEMQKHVESGEMGFDGPPNLLEDAERMTDVFKSWFTTERVDELMENAHQIADQFINNLRYNDEEE